jgi:hypothetical protein
MLRTGPSVLNRGVRKSLSLSRTFAPRWTVEGQDDDFTHSSAGEAVEPLLLRGGGTRRRTNPARGASEDG